MRFDRDIIKPLSEARITGDPEVKYKEKRINVKTTNDLDKVIAELSGRKSAVFTTLANRYAKADRFAKKAKQIKDKLNERAKKKIEPLFDVEDEVLTRVVDTAALTLTLSKATPEKTTTDEFIDYEGLLEELAEMMPELTDKLEMLLDKYTEVEVKTSAAVPPRLMSPKLKDIKTESTVVNEGFMDTVKRLGAWIMRKLARYDRKLASIKKRAGLA